MSAHRMIVAVASLMWVAAGCQGLPKVPGLARSADSLADDGVRTASYQEPVSSREGGDGSISEFDVETDEDDGLGLEDFAPSAVAATFKELTGKGPNEDVARALYQEGDELFKAGEYKEAAASFERAVERAPESPLQEDSLFMLAESQFFSDRYPDANDTYGELLQKYKYSQHLDKVVTHQFAIARYWEQAYAANPGLPLSPQLTDPTRPKLDTWGEAMKVYRSVRMNDPTGPLADDSIMATANAYFLKGRYEDAAYHYDLIRKEYPKSEHQLNAHILGMKSKLEMYQGPMYDGTPLEEAKDIAEQTMIQFRGALGEERQRLLETQNQLVQQQADRQWRIAQYYDKRKQYGSARIYYRAIAKEFPTTEAAQKASARLEEIRDFPANPTNYFKWLSQVIPSSDD